MRTVARLWREYRGLVAFMALMCVFRSAIADWNVVPSESMLPTIRPGDYIIVNKMAYALRVPFTHVSVARLHEPQRGDIVTIDSSAARELLVKRIVGVPGDSVALRDNVLYINGQRADYQTLGVDLLPGDAGARADYLVEQVGGISHRVRLSLAAPSPRRSFGPVVVPAGEYLMLGDNRDNSADSRYYGFFPRSEIMGRVRRVAFSLDPNRFDLPRVGRFYKSLV
ncbi:MAG TPA: signal peptidase I [Pararobbsia sp.]|nr:signal peptidase I [Pararobbsia sp.]